MPQHTGHPFEQYRRDLEGLNWSQGMTKDDIMSKCPNCPRELFQSIPSNYRFNSFQEFWNHENVKTGAGWSGGEGMRE